MALLGIIVCGEEVLRGAVGVVRVGVGALSRRMGKRPLEIREEKDDRG